MRNESALSAAIAGVKEKEVSSFEDMFLLTYRQTAADLWRVRENEEFLWDALGEVYIQVWHRASGMPKEGLLRAWLRIIIRDVSRELLEEEVAELRIDREESPEDFIVDERRLEDRALGILVEIEKELGILQHSREKSGEVKLYRLIPAVAAALLIASLAVFTVTKIMTLIKRDTVSLVPSKTTASAPDPTTIVIDGESDESEYEYGWNETPEGKVFKKPDGHLARDEWIFHQGGLYYFANDSRMATGSRQLRGQLVEFNDRGALTGIVRPMEKESENSYIRRLLSQYGYRTGEEIVKDSVLVDGDFIYYMAGISSGGSELMRMTASTGKLEMIDNQVLGYINLPDSIEYAKGVKILSFAKQSRGKTITDGYSLKKEGDRYALYDVNKEPVEGNEEGVREIGQRVYAIENGLVRSVSPGKQQIGGYTFTIKEDSEDPNIYTNGETVFISEGVDITAICTIGRFLYYAAVISYDNVNPISRLYRIEVDSKEREPLGDNINGTIRNLYYYGNLGSIYMEYMPESGTRAFGELARWSEKEGWQILAEDGRREDAFSNGNDFLEILLVEEDKIYTYRHDGRRRSDGTIEVKKTMTHEIAIKDMVWE